MIRQAFHGTALALAFLLELCALAALGYWGVHSGGGPLTKTAARRPSRPSGAHSHHGLRQPQPR